jgi:hypothetical protein
MRMSASLTIILAVAVVLAPCARARAQEELPRVVAADGQGGAEDKEVRPDFPKASANELVRLLAMFELETRDFVTPMTLKDALGLLFEKTAARGRPVPILVNSAAFRKEGTHEDDPYETQVSLPPLPLRVTLGKALRLFLARMPNANATYLVKDGFVEVLPETAASPKMLLQQKVLALYRGRPVAEVLEELAERCGVTIVLDPNAGPQLRQPITATFRNDVSLRDSITMLARMAGLRAEFLSTGVFITAAGDKAK